MSTEIKNKIIAVVGPTASGKSDLAVKIAMFIKKHSKKFGVDRGEIISADSRQVYKYLDIGSNKITEKEMCGIRHHLLSMASPKKTFSVARYQKLTQKTIKDITKRSGIPIICGGTGLYVDSIIFGINFPKVKPNFALRKKLEKLNTNELFGMLELKDPKRASEIDSKNKRRLIRSMEIIEATGKSIPPLGEKESKFDVLWIGLKINESGFKKKLDERLRLRIRKGLVDEVRDLHDKHGLSWKKLESFGMEYKFAAQFIQNKITRQQMIGLIVNESAKYAKRQMTWFKRNSRINWVEDKQKALDLTESFLSI